MPRLVGPMVLVIATLALAACSGGGAPADSGSRSPAPGATDAGGAAALPEAPVGGDAPEAENVVEPVLPVRVQHLGDLDGMKARRLVRVLVPYNRTSYYLDRGRQKGVAVELGYAFERELNAGASKKVTEHVHVAFMPTPRHRILSDLLEGYGDIAAAGLTVTEGRLESVDFATPLMAGVREVLVTGPTAAKLDTLDDLAGKEVYVREDSSYWEHLTALNGRLRAEGKPEIVLVRADGNLEDDDILEMVASGLLPWTVVDDYMAELWAQVVEGLTVRKDLVVNEGGTIAWAVRKDSPELRAALDRFMAGHAKGTAFGNVVYKKYLGSPDRLRNPTDEAERQKFRDVVALFQKYAGQYDLDYLLLAAQGYQESQLDQSRRSAAGAVGIMQLLPTTAGAPPIAIPGVDKDAEKNIHAGAKYLRHVIDVHLADPDISPSNRMLLAFAAYNAGPGNLAKFRALARKSGLDPNVWFQNVEIAAARIVGSETVRYVANIYKYYVAYTLYLRTLASTTAAREAGRGGP